MERTHLSDDDQGKQVVNSRGDDIGIISEVKGDMALVNPDPGITDTIRSKLGWGEADQDDTYELYAERVATVTDDQVRLKD